MPNSQRRGGLGLGLLLYQIFGVIGLDRIPPATLTIVALQVGLFLRLFRTPWRNPADVCMSLNKVWYQRQWYRFLFAAFEHADDFHLYYNMVSFIWKGISLERRLGSAKFTYLIITFTVLCNITLLLLCHGASELLSGAYVNHCSVGFSGVIFALKVLTTHYIPSDRNYLMGFPIGRIIPPHYFVWAELLLIQLMVPNASFVGHLAGILVGIAYVKGPLKPITDYFWQLISAGLFADNSSQHFRHSVPLSQSMYEQYLYHGMTEDEQLERARFASFQQERLRNAYAPYNMSEDEQLRWATEESLRHENTGGNSYYRRPEPSAPYDNFYEPPYPNNSNGVPFAQGPTAPYPEQPSTSGSNIYPNLDEVRRQRLNRFT